MNVKQFYRYVFVFLLSVFVFTGCGSDNGGGEFVSPPDTTKPVITLNGDNPYFLKLGSNYEEQGYSSNEQGQIKIENKIDNSKEGQYVITYSTSDLAGNYSEVNRTIKVIKFEDVGQKITLDEANLPDELKGKLELYGIIEDSNGKSGTAGGLIDVVAHKKITYNDIDGNKVTKPVIVYRSFNIGEWEGKINEETTLLARMFINPNLIEIPENKKIEYIQFIKTEYSDEYKEALRLQALSINSSFFTPHYYDVVSSLQNIILSKYLVEQPKQSKKLSESVFNKYDLKDKSFTNMALMQIKTAGDDIEFANYADVYYGVRVKKYNDTDKSFDYPMLISSQKLFTVNPVKGGAVGGLYDWAANQFDVTYKPTTKIKYNELFGVNKDITGQHKALIELYKWQGGYPTLLNGTRGISLLVKTVASGAAGEKVMNGVKNGLAKIQKSLDKAENIVYGVDASLSVMEIGLDIFEHYNADLKDTIKPYRDTYNRSKKVVTDAYGVLKIKPYSSNVKDLGELKQLKQLLGGIVPIVPSNSNYKKTREVLQAKLDGIKDKKEEFKVISTALLLSRIIDPLISSSIEGRKAIDTFNTKFGHKITFAQMHYYVALQLNGKIKPSDINLEVKAAIFYTENFINKKIFKSIKTTLSKYMNGVAQIPKALSFMKKLVTGGSKFIKDPIKAIKNIATFLIEAEIINLKAIAGDGILNVIARANPAGAAVKGAQIVNDWSSYLAGNVVVANKQYFQVDFDNGKVDIHLPPVQFSGVGTNGKINPIKTVQNYFVGENRFLVAVDEKSTSIQHKPRFDMFFTEKNKDGIFIDGDFEDLLQDNPAYKNKTIFKFDLNIDKSENNTEDENSFTIPTAGVQNIEIKSNHIVSADLISGNNNISYLNMMEAWEETGAKAIVSDIKRGIYKESVTVEMMPSTDPAFIIDEALKQGSTSYYAYNVANKVLIKDAIELSIEEDKNKNKVLSIKNNASYTICYEVKYDIEDGITDDVDRRQGNCIASGKTFVDNELDLYSDGTGKMNDVVFYFYDELVIKFCEKELTGLPYLYRYQKRTNRVISYTVAYSIDFDDIDNNTLPIQIDKENINISVTDKDISLSWINLVNATSYQVCMSKNPISDGNTCEEDGGTLIEDIDSQLASISITENLENNTLYYFRVSGVKDGTNGLWSDEVSIKFEGKDIPEDAKEVNLCANQTAFLNKDYTLDMQLNNQSTTGSVFFKAEDFTGAVFCGEFASATSSTDVLNTLEKSFSDATNILLKNKLDGSVKAQYEMIGENVQAFSLLKTILGQAGISDFSNYLDYSSHAEVKDVYIDLYINYVNSSTVYVILAVTDKADDNSDELNDLVTGDVIDDTKTVKQTKTDIFTYSANTLKTDILFVMDDSGSMSGEQSSASQSIIDTFGTAMSSKGIDWKATVIGTGASYSYSSYIQNPVYNDISLLASQLKIGTNGSANEEGLESAYNHLKNGDISIRSNSKLSMVYISDEVEHTSLSELDITDINDSYFVQNKIKVNVIIPLTGQYEEGYYRTDDLAYQMANATGGEVANLRNYTTGYNAMMQKIADDSAGSASEIILSETPIVATINVTINGTSVSSSNWNYNSANKSIVFIASATPSVGDKIEVTYNY
jgi:hypothetical protein